MRCLRRGCCTGAASLLCASRDALDPRSCLDVPCGCSGVSEVDLGLGIGARIKLVKSASVDVGPGPLNKALTFDTAMLGDFGPCVTDFALCPDDVGRCVVSTTLGSVLHKSRFGEAPPPRTFAPPTSALSAATAVAVSPWNPKYFLVGYANGVVWCVVLGSSCPRACGDMQHRRDG